MKRTCEECKADYDDLMQLTICPHIRFACRHGIKNWNCQQCKNTLNEVTSAMQDLLDLVDQQVDAIPQEEVDRRLDKIIGEARSRQIKDPETGDVYAPGCIIRKDGTVEYNSGWGHSKEEDSPG